MNTLVTAIKKKTKKSLSVTLNMLPRKNIEQNLEKNIEKYDFVVMVEVSDLAGHPFQSFKWDNPFSQRFRLHPDLSHKIMQLVADVYNGESVDLPVDVGIFDPSDRMHTDSGSDSDTV